MIGQGHQAGQERGDLDPGDPLLSGLRSLDPHHQVQRQVRDVGEGVARVDRHRGEDGEDAAHEEVAEVSAVGLGQRVPVGQRHPGRGQFRTDLVEEGRAVPGHQLGGPGGDGGQLLAGAHPVGRADPETGRHLVLETGHPHLEELVEAFGEDGHELDPFEEGHPVVRHQIQQPGPELEPRELAVDEAARVLEGRRQVLGTGPGPRVPVAATATPGGAPLPAGRRSPSAPTRTARWGG